jgi:hypothetical protein
MATFWRAARRRRVEGDDCLSRATRMRSLDRIRDVEQLHTAAVSAFRRTRESLMARHDSMCVCCVASS